MLLGELLGGGEHESIVEVNLPKYLRGDLR